MPTPTRDELIAYAMDKKGLDRAEAEKKADAYLAKQGGGEKPAPKAPAPSAKPKATPSTKAAPSAPAPKVEAPKAGPAVKAGVPKTGAQPSAAPMNDGEFVGDAFVVSDASRASEIADQRGYPVETKDGTHVYPAERITQYESSILVEQARQRAYDESPKGIARAYMPYVDAAERDASPADRYMRTSPASPPPEAGGSDVAAKFSRVGPYRDAYRGAVVEAPKDAEMDGKRAALKRMRPDLAGLVDEADDSEVSDLYAKHAATR